MKDNRVRAVVDAGGVAIGMLVGALATRAIPMILDYAGVDFVTLDMEHSGLGTGDVADMLCMFKGTSISPVVRVPEAQNHFITRMLDAGAHGIQVPNIETPDQARAIAAASRYPPKGNRGLILSGAHTDFRPVDPLKYFAEANARNFVIAQIESARGLENVEAIAAVEGIDVLAVGPNDLSHSLGIHGQYQHPVYVEAITRIADAARRHGKIAKAHPFTDEDIGRMVQMGYRMMMTHIDVSIFRTAAKNAVDHLRAHAKA